MVVGGELGQGQQALNGDGLVDLGHLLKEPHKGHVPELLSVLLDGGEVFTSINKLEFLINLMKLKYIIVNSVTSTQDLLIIVRFTFEI